MSYEFAVGTTVGGMVNVESLGCPAPRPGYEAFSSMLTLGDGSVRGVGYPRASWTFDFLSGAQRAALKAFCPGASAKVYVRTMDAGRSYHTWEAVMVWNAQEENDSGICLDLRVDFRLISEVE